MNLQLASLAAVAALLGCTATTLEPADAPITRAPEQPQEATEQAPAPAPAAQSSETTAMASSSGPVGQTEVTFTEAEPPPPPAAPTPKKGFTTPPTAKKPAGVFSTGK